MVSHDRHLLDQLCRQCYFVEPPNGLMRPGGYTKAIELQKAHELRDRRAREQAKRKLGKLRREVVSRARQAGQAHRQRSKRGLKIRDHDSRARRNQARVTGKDGQAGRALRQLDGRLQQARNKLAEIPVKTDFASS